MKYHLTLQYTFWTYFENHIFKNSPLWNEAYMFQQERYCLYYLKRTKVFRIPPIAIPFFVSSNAAVPSSASRWLSAD
jgi:hypothetical protein